MKHSAMLALACLLSSACFADFSSAMKAYESGDFNQAFSQYRALAELGDAASQFNMAVMLYQGQGQQAQPALAYAWFKLAEENGYGEQAKTIAERIRNELKGDDAKHADQQLLQFRSQFGVEALQQRLLPTLREPGAEQVDNERAVPLRTHPPQYPIDAARRNIEGYACAEFFLDEEGSPYNLRIYNSEPVGVFDKVTLQAMKRWRFKQNGDTNSKRFCLDYRLQGNAKMTEKGEQIRQLALQGEPVAQYQWALANAELDIPESYKLSAAQITEMFQQAAQAGIPAAQSKLGERLLSGKGCESDRAKGLNWLTFAAQGGLPEAQRVLGEQLLFGSPLERSSEKAELWLQRAYEQDDPYAPLLLIVAKAKNLGANAATPMPELAKVAEKVSEEAIYDLQIKALGFALAGDFKRAADVQQQAVKKSRRATSAMRESMQQVLEGYQQQRIVIDPSWLTARGQLVQLLGS